MKFLERNFSKSLEKSKGFPKVLVIVAHPDDETIWMGGMLLKNKWDVTIISLCRRDDKDRAPKFRKVCKSYRAKCFMSDLDDEKMNDIDSSEIINRLSKFKGKYDVIFTHGKNGEYGHKRHVDVHQAIVKMLDEKSLIAKKVFFFNYFKKGKYAYPSKNSVKFIKLNKVLLKEKKHLIKDVYGFQQGGFEERCCRSVESFKQK